MPRPAASRHAVILLVIAVALYAVARGSGAGWPIVVLAGLLAVLARHDEGLDPHDIVAAGVRAVAGIDDLRAARAAVEAVRCEAPVQA